MKHLFSKSNEIKKNIICKLKFTFAEMVTWTTDTRTQQKGKGDSSPSRFFFAPATVLHAFRQDNLIYGATLAEGRGLLSCVTGSKFFFVVCHAVCFEHHKTIGQKSTSC